MKFLEPVNFLDEKFVVRSYESGVANRVSLPSLCNYMQEADGNGDRLRSGSCPHA
jgi:hypothetical protein